MNIENRNIRFTSTVICRIFLGICCCFLAACSSQSSQNNSNIFLYAVDFSHSTLSPGNVKLICLWKMFCRRRSFRKMMLIPR